MLHSLVNLTWNDICHLSDDVTFFWKVHLFIKKYQHIRIIEWFEFAKAYFLLIGIIHLKIFEFSNFQKFGRPLFEFSKIFEKPSSNFEFSDFFVTTLCKKYLMLNIFGEKACFTTKKTGRWIYKSDVVRSFPKNIKHLKIFYACSNSEIRKLEDGFSKIWKIRKAIFQIFECSKN